MQRGDGAHLGHGAVVEVVEPSGQLEGTDLVGAQAEPLGDADGEPADAVAVPRIAVRAGAVPRDRRPWRG